ncbi:MAG TPA: molybdate ABC transporter substrate-binding protein [Rhodothermales bacterium]|nr:molybdate ABC transporter substrate-binding protein [Bacteroidota bacterium]HRK72680.1 molybdate ABC transporter substrate-binding protein [Rhodothermales bacterium]HRR07089.1 molybdate ABC transporter substrate-binding protein [Rhodothermales bacterium]
MRIIGYCIVSMWVVGCTPKTPAPLTISAAASLADVMAALVSVFTKENPNQAIRLNLGGSGLLARQIEAGAKADLFISADVHWVRYLAQRKKIAIVDTSSIGNSLAVFVHTEGMTLQHAQRIVLADPRSVPAGRYAKMALSCMGQWAEVSPKIVPVQDVKAVVRTLQLRSADVGFAYDTDALPDLVRIPYVPENCLPKIRYGISATKDGLGFAHFILSDKAKEIWTKHGFKVW